MTPNPPLVLDPRDLARLHNLALRAKVIVEGAFAGMHHNLHAGTSMEFIEHKEYAPGDEIRRIDWKVAGRMDRYYIKRFEDESEMQTFLVADVSASMGYGRRGVSKLAYASYLAGALAYLVGQQGDAAGLVTFDDETRSFLPPSTRPGQLSEIFRLLEDVKPAGRTDPARALARLTDIATKRSLIIIFSDLLDGDPTLMERLRQLRARGHDVVLFHILDPDEIDLPFAELMMFQAMEPGDERTLLADARDLRVSFRRESTAFRETWRVACLESRVEYRFASTSAPPAEVLRAFITDRQHARR